MNIPSPTGDTPRVAIQKQIRIWIRMGIWFFFRVGIGNTSETVSEVVDF